MVGRNIIGTGLVAPAIKSVYVTPAMASQWLTLMARNRSINAASLARLKRALQDGAFETTHQGIAFHGDVLVDGQHRLTAIAQTGIGAMMVVATYPADSPPPRHLDIGTKRTAGNLLEIAGVVPPGRGARYEAIARALQVGLAGNQTFDENRTFALVERFRVGIDWIASEKNTIAVPYQAGFAYAYEADPDLVKLAARSVIESADLALRSPMWLLHREIHGRREEKRFIGYHTYRSAFVHTLQALEGHKLQRRVGCLKLTLIDGQIPSPVRAWNGWRAEKGLPVGVPWEVAP